MNNEKVLQKLGLQEKEAKIYIAALEVGKGSVQDIAKKANINRATAYFVIENLMKKGLISATQEDKKQFFSPESPAQLQEIIEQQKRELDRKKSLIPDLVKNLESINAASIKKPIVKYYLGKEGIMRMAKSSFDYAKNEIMWLAFSKDRLDRFMSTKENASLIHERLKKKTHLQAIYNTSGEELKSTKDNLRISIKEKNYPLPGDIAVYGNRVRLTSYEDEIGIIIENENIAKTLASIFKLALDSAKKKRPAKK